MIARFYGQVVENADLTIFIFSRFFLQYPLCQHIMTSGARCGSPAVKGQPYCHHHHSLRRLLPKRFITWDHYENDSISSARFIPMPLLEDALSIQTAYMQIIHGVLSSQIQLPVARLALAAVRAAARNLPWVKAERAAMAGEQSDLAQDVREDREKVWSKVTNETVLNTLYGPPASAAAEAAAAASAAAPAESTPRPEQPEVAGSLPPRKQPDAAPAEPAPQTQPRSAVGESSG
jgi:hypothetical protein